jgi:DNA gyrase inhibitor GyrI
MLLWIGGLALAGAVALVGGWAYVMATVEQPAFDSVRRDGDFELRDYPALAVAEVETAGDRDAAVRAGFRPLARYIFARERGGETIAMTAPVVQQPAGEGWAVRFIMPAARPLQTLPAPVAAEPVRLRELPPARVATAYTTTLAASETLRELPPARVATVRFPGVADDALMERQTARLRRWIADQGLATTGEPPVFAYYDDPMTPGFLRRNEVMLAVAR